MSGRKLMVGCCCALLGIFACKFNPTEMTGGTLKLNISADAALAKTSPGIPATVNIEHLWVKITEVQVHLAGGEGWKTIATPNKQFDFRELAQGLTIPLEVYPLDVGHYTQIRLLLADSNEIEIAGVRSPLFIPSGVQSGIKLVRQFRIEEGQNTEICIKFNIDKAIHTANGRYLMHPTYKTCICNDDTEEPGSEPNPENPGMPEPQPGDEVVIPG